MDKEIVISICERLGSVLGVGYALLIASNTGHENAAFCILIFSALLFSCWAIVDQRWAFLILQIFYICSGVLGLLRWS